MTLLEVIVAMTLLAVGISGVLGAISACLRSSEAAASYSRGTLLAQQVAAELERSETLEPEHLYGTFEEAPAYAWTADVAAPDAQGLNPVLITVSWQEGQRQFTFETRVRPHALPAAQPTDAAPSPFDAPEDGEEDPSPMTPRGGQR